MQPTEILKNEHLVIEVVLSCLEKMAENCKATNQIDTDSAKKAITFIQEFADKFHHEKEEKYLFTAMETKGFPRDGGPTGVMIHEHEEGRGHVRAMAEALEKNSSEAFADAALKLINLLRQHIAKENSCLFTMAEQAFTDDDRNALIKQFQSVGQPDKLLQLAKELADKFGIEQIKVQ